MDNQRICLILLLICFCLIISLPQRSSCSSSNHGSLRRWKREAYKLPAGAKEINLDKDFKKTFKCEPGKDGFFADTDNDCKVFHRCRTVKKKSEHHSFICNKGQVFDQSTFTCTRTDDAIPCDASPMFYDLNERIGSDGPFLTDADIERAKAARPQYRRRKRRHQHQKSSSKSSKKRRA